MKHNLAYFQVFILAGKQTPNDLRIDVVTNNNAEARFTAPPHQSQLN
jgi:hypothetical protein